MACSKVLVFLAAALLLSVVGHQTSCAQDSQPTSELKVNLYLSNLLPDRSYDIAGVYVAPASQRPLRGNKQIDWSENFLASPLRHGDAAELAVDCTKDVYFDMRVDVKTANGIVQYFHRTARFPEAGKILHMAIVSTEDGSAQWKIDDRVDTSFGR